MDENQIDELIWGNFKSEIIEMSLQLQAGKSMIRSMAMDGALALFFGFLHFMQFKRGLAPNFEFMADVSISKRDNIIPDFKDLSWWVKNLEHPDMMKYSFSMDMDPKVPNFFIQYIEKNGDKHTIRILMDTFSFFESGMILNETKLDNESRYSFSDISKEFHVMSDCLTDALWYFKALENVEIANTHLLVFRPSKLVEYITTLDDSLTTLKYCPNHVVRKEKYDKMSLTGKAGIHKKSESSVCDEKNIRELLDEHSIKISNVEFVTFYEYLKDKLDSNIRNEWGDIRDRYISNMKKSFSKPDPLTDYSKAKDYLQKSSKFIEAKNYSQAILFAYKAIENVLNIFYKNKKLSMREKIDELRSYDQLQNHVINLHHVRKTRNPIAHDNSYEPSEADATECLAKVNRFLADI